MGDNTRATGGRRGCLRLLLWIVGTVAALVVVCLAIGFAHSDGIPPDEPYDKSRWDNAEDEAFDDGPLRICPRIHPVALRAAMVNDVMANHLRIGMTEAEVRTIMPDPRGSGGHFEPGVSTGYEVHELLMVPTLRQRLQARRRWGTSDPFLEVEYRDGRIARVWVH